MCWLSHEGIEVSRFPGWIRETIQNPKVSPTTFGAPPIPPQHSQLPCLFFKLPVACGAFLLFCCFCLFVYQQSLLLVRQVPRVPWWDCAPIVHTSNLLPSTAFTGFLPFPFLLFYSSTSAFWGCFPNKHLPLIFLPPLLLLWKPNLWTTENNETHTPMKHTLA